MIDIPVVIVGTGLVGASIGCALSQRGTQVYLQDLERPHALVAASLGGGLVDEPPHEAVGLVVVAVPPDAIAEVVKESLDTYPNAVVTDVASVKAKIIAQLKSYQVDLSRYVGSHPMAGSHLAGPLTANPDLFQDRTWVVSAADEANPNAVKLVKKLAKCCGSRIVELPIADHDVAVAQVSHVPQIMSSLTAAHLREVDAAHLELAGQGIRDVTRIAGSDPVLWRQIISANSCAIRKELAAIRDDLNFVLENLDNQSVINDFLADGRKWARRLPGKHGQDRSDYQTVIVQIPDEPGSLASLFAAIQKVGVNVEDLSIEHDSKRTVGFLSILVRPELADKLRSAIVDNGWSLRS